VHGRAGPEPGGEPADVDGDQRQGQRVQAGGEDRDVDEQHRVELRAEQVVGVVVDGEGEHADAQQLRSGTVAPGRQQGERQQRRDESEGHQVVAAKHRLDGCLVGVQPGDPISAVR
jgi:hypothetical protein